MCIARICISVLYTYVTQSNLSCVFLFFVFRSCCSDMQKKKTNTGRVSYISQNSCDSSYHSPLSYVHKISLALVWSVSSVNVMHPGVFAHMVFFLHFFSCQIGSNLIRMCPTCLRSRYSRETDIFLDMFGSGRHMCVLDCSIRSLLFCEMVCLRGKSWHGCTYVWTERAKRLVSEESFLFDLSVDIFFYLRNYCLPCHPPTPFLGRCWCFVCRSPYY